MAVLTAVAVSYRVFKSDECYARAQRKREREGEREREREREREGLVRVSASAVNYENC